MLTTFVIALREGLEASLIVGIIAAFLRRSGRTDGLRAMWAGVALAVVLCVGVAVVLRVVDDQLPHRAQEGLETIVALVAVAMVTYMIVWMTNHSRDLRGRLQSQAAGALETGSMWALVGMACFAVLREGFETSVFLLAAFNDATDTTAAGLGVVLGLAVAIALGYGIYRGGVHINLSRFFRATGVVLVIVAAGLVASALHSAAEAGWVTGGQAQALDLSAVVRPGTVWESLITGILGIQAQPTVIEVAGWLIYAVPMLFILLAPQPLRAGTRASFAGAAVVAAPVVLVAGTLGGGAPASTAATPGARTVDVGITDAGCSPATLRLPLGPRDVRRHRRQRRLGVRGRPRRSRARRGGGRRRGDHRALLAHAPAGRVHAALSGRRRPARRDRCACRDTGGTGAGGGRARLSRLPRAPDGDARPAHPGARRGARRRRRRRGPPRLRGRPRAVRADRAGRRELRRPRPGDRRPRERRAACALDGLPPDRAPALGAGHHRGNPGARRQARRRHAPPAPARADGEAGARQIGNGANELLGRSQVKLNIDDERCETSATRRDRRRANDVPRAHWTGFHPIERRLWVQDTTAGTRALAAKLDADTRRLRRLVRTVRLEPAQIGNGANELLGEVAKSKITGEEERYSHLDLLDFQANVTGARAAFDAIRPALDARDRPLAGEIEQRFGGVEAALRPHRAAGGGFEPYTELTHPDVRRLAQVIDALAEPLSQAPARALTG